MLKTCFAFSGLMISFLLASSLHAANGSAVADESFSLSGSPCLDQKSASPQKEFIEQICVLTNQARTSRKLRPLTLSASLSQVAQLHAEDMSKRGYFSHTSLNGDSPFDRIGRAQIKFRSAAENIARGHTTPSKTIRGWMNSPGHRRNILGPSYGKIGIGYYDNHWVQVFTD